MWRVYRQTEDGWLEKFSWALRRGELEINNWWQQTINNFLQFHICHVTQWYKQKSVLVLIHLRLIMSWNMSKIHRGPDLKILHTPLLITVPLPNFSWNWSNSLKSRMYYLCNKILSLRCEFMRVWRSRTLQKKMIHHTITNKVYIVNVYILKFSYIYSLI